MDNPAINEPVKPYTSVKCAKEAKEVIFDLIIIPNFSQVHTCVCTKLVLP